MSWQQASLTLDSISIAREQSLCMCCTAQACQARELCKPGMGDCCIPCASTSVRLPGKSYAMYKTDAQGIQDRLLLQQYECLVHHLSSVARQRLCNVQARPYLCGASMVCSLALWPLGMCMAAFLPEDHVALLVRPEEHQRHILQKLLCCMQLHHCQLI